MMTGSTRFRADLLASDHSPLLRPGVSLKTQSQHYSLFFTDTDSESHTCMNIMSGSSNLIPLVFAVTVGVVSSYYTFMPAFEQQRQNAKKS